MLFEVLYYRNTNKAYRQKTEPSKKVYNFFHLTKESKLYFACLPDHPDQEFVALKKFQQIDIRKFVLIGNTIHFLSGDFKLL